MIARSPSARLAAWLIAAALLAGLLAACATLIGPRQLEVPQARMQQSLERKFPVHRRVLGVFEVELHHPQLAILANSERVALTLEVKVQPLLGRQVWRGSMAVSGRLMVDTARRTIALGALHVDQLLIDGMEQGKQNQIASVANLLGETTLNELVVYTFEADQLRYAGVPFQLTGISTRPGALVAHLQPVP